MLYTVSRDCITIGFPSQYMHQKGTDLSNLVAKFSIFNEPIIMVRKKIIPERNSTYDKFHVSFRSTSSCNIQPVSELLNYSVFKKAK